jgi:spore coat protein A, manganese oxidase
MERRHIKNTRLPGRDGIITAPSLRRNNEMEDVMISRRSFLKLSGAGVLSLYAAVKGKFALRAQAQIPAARSARMMYSSIRRPCSSRQSCPRLGRSIKQRGGKNIDYYEISMKQFGQQILPVGFPMTTVWGYGSVNGAGSKRALSAA